MLHISNPIRVLQVLKRAADLCLYEEAQMFNDLNLMSNLIDMDFDFIVIDVPSTPFHLPYVLDKPFATLAIDCLLWPSKTPYMPSFVPCPFTTTTDKMTFLERMQNIVFSVLLSLLMKGGSAPGVIRE